MTIPTTGWANKNGTAERSCKCGTWKNHWVNFANEKWPLTCSVNGCSTSPTLGAHVYHSNVQGERIVPMCNSCNGRSDTFSLKEGITKPKANKSETCG